MPASQPASQPASPAGRGCCGWYSLCAVVLVPVKLLVAVVGRHALLQGPQRVRLVPQPRHERCVTVVNLVLKLELGPLDVASCQQAERACLLWLGLSIETHVLLPNTFKLWVSRGRGVEDLENSNFCWPLYRTKNCHQLTFPY